MSDFQLPPPPAPATLDAQPIAPEPVTFGTWPLPDYTLPVSSSIMTIKMVNSTVTVSAQWQPVFGITVSPSGTYSHTVSVVSGTEVTNSENVSVDVSAGFDKIISLGAEISKSIGHSVTVSEATTVTDSFSVDGEGSSITMFAWQAVYTYTIQTTEEVYSGHTLMSSIPMPPFHLVNYDNTFSMKQYPEG